MGLATLSGCNDIPTEVPLIDVRWVFPIDDQSLSVAELLPANVTISGTSFAVGVRPFSVTQTLGGISSAFIIADGNTVPKPAFNIQYQDVGSLPTDVGSVELESGTVSLGIQNSLGFDPINPAAATTGTMTITLYSGTVAAGNERGQVILDGATATLPSGAVTMVPMTLTPGTISSTIVAVVDLNSPLGDPVLIDINASLDITVTVGSILVSSATVDVDGLSVDIDETQLDLEDIDPAIVSNIQEGSLILDVQNPFGVAIDVVVEIGSPLIPVLQKNMTIGSGPTSTATLSYTGADLQSFLGQPDVFFRGSGTVIGGPATVTPTQVVVIEAKLDVMLEIGG